MKGEEVGSRGARVCEMVVAAVVAMVRVSEAAVERVLVIVVGAGSEEGGGGGVGFRGGGLGGWRGVVVVGLGLMWWRMRLETVSGVTLSMKVKAGRRRTVVGAEAAGCLSWSSGRGRLEAESISFWTGSLALCTQDRMKARTVRAQVQSHIRGQLPSHSLSHPARRAPSPSFLSRRACVNPSR